MSIRAWRGQRLALVSAQFCLGPIVGFIAEFMELRTLLANKVVGWWSLEDPLLAVAGFGK